MHESNIEAPHAHWASSTQISTEVLFGAEIELITKEQFLNNSSQIAPRLEGMSKDAHIPQYVREKLQEARELLVADIDWVKLGNTLPPKSHVKIGTMTNISSKRKFKPSKNQAKKKIRQTFQLAPEVNEGESGALSPSANESNNGHPINTTNDHPVEIPDIGGVTNHHENIVPSPILDTQEATTVPNENIGTETQRTVAEDEIVLTQTNSDPSMDSAACTITLPPSPSCMKIKLENENKFDYILMSYHVFKREDWIKFNLLIQMTFMKRKLLVPKDEFPTKVQCGIL
ncbi:hypothetical protein O181_118789 [Austropuccinia psidii MF-1]|uniref:Uncharacterized protein n=1 Tax=Austropuccinia psidii MF-1 TaxID=1389203 RepID=A0A9Q3KDE6_9BASI|nr:hypothetical protein [Austropuccinia psidii MF-1]